ncbi:hypothetical protein B0J13DRAFT_247556 [Dactylonectria estremocensis]|uniref:Uncharacterized protein n=1 Tax=Dactylonectria estremocensis TaxID=1079267 RepID=A0A9P9J704_9HYPO|nr:hypothetical protein B0J13DRAFT_247556 [Dactylonectria estremocensis]
MGTVGGSRAAGSWGILPPLCLMIGPLINSRTSWRTILTTMHSQPPPSRQLHAIYSPRSLESHACHPHHPSYYLGTLQYCQLPTFWIPSPKARRTRRKMVQLVQLCTASWSHHPSPPLLLAAEPPPAIPTRDRLPGIPLLSITLRWYNCTVVSLTSSTPLPLVQSACPDSRITPRTVQAPRARGVQFLFSPAGWWRLLHVYGNVQRL